MNAIHSSTPSGSILDKPQKKGSSFSLLTTRSLSPKNENKNHDNSRSIVKLNYIDALRGVAIFGVLLVHSNMLGNNEQLPTIIKLIVSNGACGVQLFFIVSAFTLFYSFDNKSKKEKNAVRNFFIRRFFRIAPMYYIGICYYLWQDGLAPRYFTGYVEGISWGNIAANCFFLHGISPYWINSLVPGGWSIAVEMMFYLLVPFLFAKIKNLDHASIFILFSLTASIIFKFFLKRLHPLECDRLWSEYLFFYLPNQLPIFGLGIFLFFLIMKKADQNISPSTLWAGSAVLFIFGLNISHFTAGIAFLLVGIALSKQTRNFIVNPFSIYLGKISYSMYIVHFAIIHWFNKCGLIANVDMAIGKAALMCFGIKLTLFTLTSMGISSLFYRIVEIPTQQGARKLIENLEKRRAFASLGIADSI